MKKTQKTFLNIATNIYPVTYKLLSKNWNELLSCYLKKHPSSSSLSNKVFQHLPEYLSKKKDILNKYPFVKELAHYEWLGVEIYEREVKKQKNKKVKNIPVLNPVHEICTFHYAIPEIVEMIEDEKPLGKIHKQKTNVLIYRDPKDLSVRFFELSTSTLAFVELLKSGFSIDMVIYFLANAYKVDEKNYKSFEREAKKLVNLLKKNRILV